MNTPEVLKKMEKIMADSLPKNTKPNMLSLPLGGMGLFVLFYILAALNYPGGSWVAREQDGFSVWHNHLCYLLDVYTVIGVLNTALFMLLPL